MTNKTELQKELLLKEQRVTFWEKHHRLMPKGLFVFNDRMAEFKYE